MTFEQIASMIEGIGIPYAYYQFDETGQAPPFICFYYSGDNDVKADNLNYQKIEQLIVEVYTRNKDFELEASVENALSNAGLVYSRNEVYINSEKLYQVVYSCDVLIQSNERFSPLVGTGQVGYMKVASGTQEDSE